MNQRPQQPPRGVVSHDHHMLRILMINVANVYVLGKYRRFTGGGRGLARKICGPFQTSRASAGACRTPGLLGATDFGAALSRAAFANLGAGRAACFLVAIGAARQFGRAR
jgi:hypothetical protein